MKCINCGGELHFKEGLAFCENCSKSYPLNYGLDNTEVYICCIERDSFGRRTNDSLIAEKIYQDINQKNIFVFYKNKSVSHLSADELPAANYQAIYHAKIILIVGCTTENFECLTSEFSMFFSGKTVIPIYTDVNPHHLPSELNQLQALDFNSIGAENDLINGILKILGKDSEIKIENLRQSTKKKKKVIACVIALFLIISIAFTVFFLLYGKSEPKTEKTYQETYDKAQALLETRDYLGAAELLFSISDFNDSKNILNDIYNRYDGYYISESNDISFYINIQNSATANIIIERTSVQGKKVSVKEASTLNNNTITATYTDSQNNTGEMYIVLNNDDIHLKTSEIETNMKSLSLGNLDVTFQLSQRSDRPIEQGVDNEAIIQWLTAKTSLSDLKQSGYQLDFDSNLTSGGGTNDHFVVYSIVNTDIKLLLADFDLSTTTSYDDMESHALSDFYIVGIIATASIVSSQKLGKASCVYNDNDILYATNVQNFILMSDPLGNSPEYCISYSFDENRIGDKITENSVVGITSKNLIGQNFNWVEESLKEKHSEALVAANFNKSHLSAAQNYYTLATIVAKQQNIYLICVHCNSPQIYNKYYYYKSNILTGEVQFITELTGDSDYSTIDLWKNYPDLFGDFLKYE